MEFDLRRFAGIRLLDWFRGLVTSGEVIRAISVLPPQSAYQARLRQYAKSSGRPPEPWVQFYSRANDTSEMVRHLWELMAAVNTGKGRQPPRFPDPMTSAGRSLFSTAKAASNPSPK